MKRVTIAILCFIIVGTVSPGHAQNGSSGGGGNSNIGDGGAGQDISSPLTLPIYRFYKYATGEHFFTGNYYEGIGAGFIYEQAGFYVLSSQTPGTIGLYRCVIPGFEHFISSDPNCEGQRTEGLYGYVYASPTANMTPFYRLDNPSNGDHLESFDPAEGTAVGYHLEGCLGYTLSF